MEEDLGQNSEMGRTLGEIGRTSREVDRTLKGNGSYFIGSGSYIKAMKLLLMSDSQTH